MIQVKRVYDAPSPHDGARFLVDRLWPRGLKKEALKLKAWVKEIAPSHGLRRWFHGPEGSWPEFHRLYRKELTALDPKIWQPLVQAARRGNITLLYAAKDPLRNHAILLKKFLSSRPSS